MHFLCTTLLRRQCTLRFHSPAAHARTLAAFHTPPATQARRVFYAAGFLFGPRTGSWYCTAWFIGCTLDGAGASLDAQRYAADDNQATDDLNQANFLFQADDR